MFRIVSSALLVPVLLGIGAAPGSAQELIPRDLALALLSGYGPVADADAPRFSVGELPEGIPHEAVPPGADVLGGIWSAQRSAAALTVRAEVRTALATVAERLQGAGWEAVRMGSGLVALPHGQDPREAFPPTVFCSDEAMLRISISRVDRVQDVGSMRIDVERGGAVSPSSRCALQHRGAFAGIPAPELRAPDGSRLSGSASGSSEDSYHSRTGVITTLGAAELAFHFAAQLRDAGWELDSPMLTESAASHRLRFRDDQGRQWRGVLGVAAVPGFDEREVLLRMWREGAEERRQGLSAQTLFR